MSELEIYPTENSLPRRVYLEADYRSIGVGEIVLIDPCKKQGQPLRETNTGYSEAQPTAGQLTLACVPGFAIEVEGLFVDDKPNPYTVVKQRIESGK